MLTLLFNKKLKPKLLHLELAHLDYQICAQIAAHFREGKLVIYPTDTIYGIGCEGLNSSAVQRLNRVKRRQKGKPLLLLIPGPNWVFKLARSIPTYYKEVAARFWPGPLTLIFKAAPVVPTAVCGAQSTVGLRWADSRMLDAVLSRVESPLASTSANISGRVPITDPSNEENSLLEEVDLVVDAGCIKERESTVLDLSSEVPRILRQGAISKDTLQAALSLPL